MDSQILDTLFALDRSSAANRERFRGLANELDLVVRGLRQACLVEHHWPWKSVQQHETVMNKLRITTTRFNRVVLLWAELAHQVLFLNVDVFKRGYQSTWTNFLEIRSPPLFRRHSPGNVVAALTWIHDTCGLNSIDSAQSQSPPEVVILPFESPETLVPLAGALLEYPVAFVPPAPLTETAYFTGETLDFFEVTLRSLAFDPPSTLATRPLIKFSCPTSAYANTSPKGLEVPITRSTLTDQIKRRWTERLRTERFSSGEWNTITLDILVYSKKVDGIAL